MCDDGGAADARVAAPRPAEGAAVDPIALEPVDEVVVTVLVDNSFDGLLADAGPGRRARLGAVGTLAAPHFEDGWTNPGLVAEHVLTGCGHAGAVNIARHALRLTGSGRLHAMLGGFHLSGLAFEPIIEPTVTAFAELAPDALVPAHCTGWKAQQRFATVLGDAFVPNAVGTTYTFAAAA